MTTPKTKSGAAGAVEHVMEKLLRGGVDGLSSQECSSMAEWLGAALVELDSAADERGTRSLERVGRRLGVDRRLTCSEEWGRWVATKEAQAMKKAGTLRTDLIARDRYLENRLWFAFIAGWEAAEAGRRANEQESPTEKLTDCD